jgi:hypothetical protein
VSEPILLRFPETPDTGLYALIAGSTLTSAAKDDDTTTAVASAKTDRDNTLVRMEKLPGVDE